jgi:hypothetical protein
MARLRIRVELNRRDAGVPMTKMVSVVEETQKFLNMLAQDVQIAAQPADWVAADFDSESLNFTAEYTRPVSPEQVRAFGEAFNGSTSLRQSTIAQFTQIAEAIGEDELIGFGLYQSDQEKEPSEWRCLSRRDAIRIANDIHMLASAVGSDAGVSPLPPVQDASVGGRRLFRGRRDGRPLMVDPAKSLREIEATLSQRIALLERQLETYNRKVDAIGNAARISDARFQRMMAAMETFWGKAPPSYRQLAAPQNDPVLHAELRETRWVWPVITLLLFVALALMTVFWHPGAPARFEQMRLPEPSGRLR